MKRIQNLLTAALCGTALSVFAQVGGPGYATVVRVAGTASYSIGAGQPQHPLVAGKVLPVGAIIHTGHNGVVDVVLGKVVSSSSIQSVWHPQSISFAADAPVRGMISYEPKVEQNVVRLTPDTVLGIDKLEVSSTGVDSVSDTELNLKKGKIFATVKKLTGASQYLIKLPNGIAGVRGTQFSITADGIVVVFESTGGGVVLSLVSPNGQTHTYLITPGNLLDPSTGAPTPIPPSVLRTLAHLFNAMPTFYHGPPSYIPPDNTKCFVSPVQGYGGSRP